MKYILITAFVALASGCASTEPTTSPSSLMSKNAVTSVFNSAQIEKVRYYTVYNSGASLKRKHIMYVEGLESGCIGVWSHGSHDSANSMLVEAFRGDYTVTLTYDSEVRGVWGDDMEICQLLAITLERNS
ncbi:hypothetical protein ACFSJ3_05425 [Corallincola platygyrae]|uniref:Lipoprotein n=1 Tax=Corallincola platygyrae TaxID=1193278 RepID=A0ABW4XN16_9GAMM